MQPASRAEGGVRNAPVRPEKIEERRARQAKWDAGVADGSIIPRSGATHSDKGKPRPEMRMRKRDEVDEEEDDEASTPEDAERNGDSTTPSTTSNQPIVTWPPASPAVPTQPAPKRRKTNGAGTGVNKAPPRKSYATGNKENGKKKVPVTKKGAAQASP
ncbi:hypothetical protein C8R45DRAFT_931566 [Mycena sanguinolenta]|nr:hypothetical protein C8R45DRAFT_931566 [Mycena sanguinolenta]